MKKNFKQFLINLAVGFVLLNIFGFLFLRGESFPPPPMKDKLVYVIRVPSSSPLTP